MQQIILLVLFVLPGITYQFARERMRGPVPGERDLAERVLRALLVGAEVALCSEGVLGNEHVRPDLITATPL